MLGPYLDVDWDLSTISAFSPPASFGVSLFLVNEACTRHSWLQRGIAARRRRHDLALVLFRIQEQEPERMVVGTLTSYSFSLRRMCMTLSCLKLNFLRNRTANKCGPE